MEHPGEINSITQVNSFFWGPLASSSSPLTVKALRLQVYKLSQHGFQTIYLTKLLWLRRLRNSWTIKTSDIFVGHISKYLYTSITKYEYGCHLFRKENGVFCNTALSLLNISYLNCPHFFTTLTYLNGIDNLCRDNFLFALLSCFAFFRWG